METLVLDGRQTIVLAIFVLFFGKFLTSKVPFPAQLQYSGASERRPYCFDRIRPPLRHLRSAI